MTSPGEVRRSAARRDDAASTPVASPALLETAARAGSRDPARTTLAVLFIAGMVALSFWIVRPFLPAAVWAATIVIATWPLLIRVQRLLWGRRGLAVAVMTAVLLLALILPLAFALAIIVARSEDIVRLVQAVAVWSAPPPPDWLGRLPVAGQRLASRWQEFAALTREELAARLSPYTRQVVGWALGTVGSVGMVLVQFLLVVLSAAILYAYGDTAATRVSRFARRVAGPRGDAYIRLAGQAIRGVALGIIVTALIQTALAGVGLVVAGAPFPGLLTALVLVLCIAQIGAALPLLLAAGWIYWSGDRTWGMLLLIWTLFVCGIDNVLRPVLIRRGADLPLLLVFLGVIGGLLAFGIIGIFIGPVVLAVGHTLLTDWMGAGDPDLPEAVPPGDGSAKVGAA
jgi:predicted PurR-regulated permease PerM